MAQRIVLDKRTKTIKVVNRHKAIRLQHSGKVGPTGKGVKGDKGDTGISTMVRVVHGGDANAARPDALYVEWMGSVAPLNGTSVDTWVITP